MRSRTEIQDALRNAISIQKRSIAKISDPNLCCKQKHHFKVYAEQQAHFIATLKWILGEPTKA